MSASFILGLYRKGQFRMDRKSLRCNFKGSTVTNTTTYTATPEEKEMYALNNEMVKKYIPNAEKLNNTAADILWDSIGSNQVNFDALNSVAQQQISDATKGLTGLLGKNNQATADANNALSALSPQYASVADKANAQLASSGNGMLTAANATNGLLGRTAPQYSDAANAANSQLSSLENGVLPATYQENMQNAIRSTIDNTMGSALNGLGQRGVLNSSVTGSVMNDISKNAADAVAQQYQNNINTVSNLAQQQLGNTNAALGAQTDLAQQQLGNTNAALEAQGSLAQQQLGNTNAALEAQGSLAQQQYANEIGNNELNMGLLSSLIDTAGTGIGIGAAAQEAAQQPALNLWQASLGLTPSGSGALSAVAGKGTTTSTQKQSDSSGIWGGLASGLASGLGTGLVGLFCFIGGTKIDTPHGKVKIRNIKKGDKVISFNPETCEDEITTVTKVSEPILEKVYAVQAKDKYGVKHYAVTTASQPLLRSDGNYITVDKLIMGQTELMGVGIVENISYSGKQMVYDICTDTCHNYYANGFIAQDGSEAWGKEV